LTTAEQSILAQSDAAAAVGSVEQIRDQVAEFVAQTQVDELIITSQIFDHEARCRSYSIAFEACSNIKLESIAHAN
jgi:alkanesulfonate monooxygenase SsuD/methylene tetrahydromethanopterin reductase-like flavin-dependent oxidoreductase (luciferase family)